MYLSEKEGCNGMLVYYFVSFGFSLLFTLLYVLIWHKHFDVHFTLLFTFIPISNLGFVLRAISNNLGQAIVANDIIYLGSTFLTLFIMMCIFDRCNIDRRRRLIDNNKSFSIGADLCNRIGNHLNGFTN